MNEFLSTIVEWGHYVLVFDMVVILAGCFGVYVIKPLYPEWWRRNIVAPYPFELEMAEKFCNLLNLDINAGLGRRLAEAEIKPDAENTDLYYILSRENVVEAAALADALSVRAEKLHLRNVRFKPVRTLTC